MASWLRLPLILVALSAALVGCVGEPSPPDETTTEVPVGPLPAPDGPLTLDRVVGIVTAADGPATTEFSGPGELSTSGADLASESDYWVAVGGRPAQCAGVVSAPYLVSAADTGNRLDDPSSLLGTLTEIDEERFGLVQVYARQFDDAGTASGFLTELTATVQSCSSYQLVDGDTVTWNAVALAIVPLSDPPSGVSGLRYVETLRDSSALEVTTTFLQRDGIVISIYGEIIDSSTISEADVDAVAGLIAGRLAQL